MLENEQAEFLKMFDGHLADVKSHLAQQKPVPVEKAYQCFSETYDDLKKNRQQQRKILKPKYFTSFDGNTERQLAENEKTIEWLVEQIPRLRDNEEYRSCVPNQRKDTMRVYTMSEKS